jgi:hypothetical protein
MAFKSNTLSLLLLIASYPSIAVELQPGVLYQAGTAVESSQLGVALTIPKDWVGALPKGAEFFVMESAQLQARLYLVIKAISQQQLEQALSEPLPLGGGIVLQPTSKPRNNQGLLEADYSVLDMGQSVPAFVSARVLKPQLSAAVIVLPANQGGQLKQAASRIIKSIKTLAVAEAAPAMPSAGANSWQAYLRGRHIKRYNTHSDYQEIQNLWLCSDGSFRKTFHSGGFSMSGASGATQSGKQGRWQARGDSSGEGSLTLQFADGGSTSYLLALKDKLYLDGVQWLRVKNEYCQ